MPIKHILLAVAFAAATAANAVPTNVAPAGTATQSSTDYGGPASRANDGNTNGNWGDMSVSHTGHEPNAWWEVALTGAQVVSAINVFNRTDCCADRLSPFTVTLFNGGTTAWSSPGNTFLASITGANVSGMEFSLANVTGDRVRVTLDGTNYLHLAEVQVMATPVPEASSALMALAGLSVLGFMARRRGTQA